MATRVDDKIQAGHHVVQFYERDENLALAVASFLGAGLVGDEAVLIVATPEHRAAFEGVMRAAGIDLKAMAASGRYVNLDAADVLSRFMVDGQPDAGRFAASVGLLVKDTAAGRPIRIYGEMVALLWDEGNVSAAIALEALWNDLATTQTFALFCAYPVQSVAGSPDHDVICQHHSDVIPEAVAPPSPPDQASQRFEPTRFAASAARRFVTSVLQGWGHDELIDAAALVVSELATNAVVHVGHRFTVSLHDRGDVVRIAVLDDSTTGPTVRSDDRSNRGTNGRGMHLVAAAAREWGTEGEPDGKTVWADLDVPNAVISI